MSRATATGIRLKLPTPRFSRSLSPRVSSRGSFVHGWHAAKGEAYVDNYESCSRSYERTRTWARKRKANRDIAQKAPLPPSSRSARLAFISPRSVTRGSNPAERSACRHIELVRGRRSPRRIVRDSAPFGFAVGRGVCFRPVTRSGVAQLP